MRVIVTGLDELREKYRRAERDIRPALEKGMRKAMYYVHSQTPAYPAAPIGSTYRRTGTLGRSISTDVKPVGGSVTGIIGTPVEYAPYVIDEDRQAWMHRGRWWTLQSVVRKSLDRVVEILGDTLEDMLK